jgi:hypothetical protein
MEAGSELAWVDAPEILSAQNPELATVQQPFFGAIAG